LWSTVIDDEASNANCQPGKVQNQLEQHSKMLEQLQKLLVKALH
jgi:hypothetical protein